MVHHTHKISWDDTYLLDPNKPKIKGFEEIDTFDPTSPSSHYRLLEDNKHTPIGFVREDVIVGFDTETLRHTITFTKLIEEVPHYD